MIINALYPIGIKQAGAGYACQSIIEAMKEAGVSVQLYSITADKEMLSEYNRLTLSPVMARFGYKLLSNNILHDITEWKFKNSFNQNVIGYIWPSTSLATIKKIHSKNHLLIMERINTHKATSKVILDNEYNRLGMNLNHGIKDEHIEDENKKIGLVDYVYSPSNEVTKSLVSANVPYKKIIQTSYGLRASDIVSSQVLFERTKRKKLTGIFVGRIGIRKGVHLLLKYWVDSGVEGTLKLVGNIEPNFRHIIEPYLKRNDIEHVEFVSDLRSLYCEADVFLLPSLEEGSPLVTYLAIGAGLPCVVSSMGSAGIIRHDKEGLIVNPHDSATWIESLNKVFSDKDIRARFAMNAHNLAPEYLWVKVGNRRLEMLQEYLKNR